MCLMGILMGSFRIYSQFAHWSSCDQSGGLFSKNSKLAPWVFAPLPPVSPPTVCLIQGGQPSLVEQQGVRPLEILTCPFHLTPIYTLFLANSSYSLLYSLMSIIAVPFIMTSDTVSTMPALNHYLYVQTFTNYDWTNWWSFYYFPSAFDGGKSPNSCLIMWDNKCNYWTCLLSVVIGHNYQTQSLDAIIECNHHICTMYSLIAGQPQSGATAPDQRRVGPIAQVDDSP